MAVTTTTIAAILKRLYPQKRLQNLVYQDNPLFAMLPKQGGFGGAVMARGVRYADTMGRAQDITTDQTGAKNSAFKAVQFLLTGVED